MIATIERTPNRNIRVTIEGQHDRCVDAILRIASGLAILEGLDAGNEIRADLQRRTGYSASIMLASTFNWADTRRIVDGIVTRAREIVAAPDDATVRRDPSRDPVGAAEDYIRDRDGYFGG